VKASRSIDRRRNPTRHVLDLGRARQGRVGELELPHDLVALEADEDVAVVEVGVQLRGRVLGEREQRP
jgi:hypothetical protein